MMMRRIKAEMPRDKKSEFLSQETAGISVAPPPTQHHVTV